MMGSRVSDGARRIRPSLVRGATHALMLVAIGLVAGLTSLTASAAEPEAAEPEAAESAQGRDQLPVAVIVLQSPADVQLKVGESATLDRGALTVTLLAVTEDSRCPKDVLCVWSGQAVVALHVELDGLDRGEAKATLLPGRRDQPHLAATVDRYVLTLTDVQPYPDRSHPEPTLETVATLHVTTAP